MARMFLDVEAEEDDDEDDDEDDPGSSEDDGLDTFLAYGEGEDEDEPTQDVVHTPFSSDRDRDLDDDAYDAEKAAEEIRERHRRMFATPSALPDVNELPQHLLAPSVSDPHMWMFEVAVSSSINNMCNPDICTRKRQR